MAIRQLDTIGQTAARTAGTQRSVVTELATSELARDSLNRIDLVADPLPPRAQALALGRFSGGRLDRAGLALLRLQRLHGNQYVQRVVAHAQRETNPAAAPMIQTKLVLGPAHDRYEREADRMAQRLMGAGPESSTHHHEDCADMARPGPPIQHMHHVEGDVVDFRIQQSIEQARGRGRPLGSSVRHRMEQRFGTDFSGVRVHTDARADQLNRLLAARAFTAGQDIFLRKGEPGPHNRAGWTLIAHELTHVVQQRGNPPPRTYRPGTGRPVVMRNGVDTFLERLQETSDLTTLIIMLSGWDREAVRDVAQRIGIGRFKEMVSALGYAEVEQLGPDALRGVTTIDDILRLPQVPLVKAADLARRWGVPIPDFAAQLDSRLPGEKIALPTAMKLCREFGVGLAGRLRIAIAHFPVKIETLLPDIESASKTDRELASQDAALMKSAKARLDEDTYLALLPALGVYNRPDVRLREAAGKWTSHMQGDEADVSIRAHLAAFVVGAVRAGRKVEGEISVVGEEDFNVAFRRQWGRSISPTRCNAFVDVSLPKRHIWIHKNRGNAGTAVHEGMHKYASATLRNELIKKYPGAIPISQLDEGITEYFTRRVTDTLGIVRGNYADQFEIAKRLVGLVTDKAVASAYFDGDFEGLKRRYMTAKGATMADWDSFAKATEEERWSDAEALL